MAQAAALVLAASAVSLGALGIPGMSGSKPVAPTPPDPDEKLAEVQRLLPKPQDAPPPLDLSAMAHGLTMTPNAPKAAIAASDPGDPIDNPGEDDGDPDADASEGVAFLGTISVGDKEFAVIRHKSRQFWLAPGRERQGVRLEEIGDGFIRVVVGGVPQRVTRGARDSGVISSARLPAVEPMGMQPGQRVRGMDPGRSSARIDPGGARPGLETPANFADMSVEERREWVQRRNEAARAARGASVTEDQR